MENGKGCKFSFSTIKVSKVRLSTVSFTTIRTSDILAGLSIVRITMAIVITIRFNKVRMKLLR